MIAFARASLFSGGDMFSNAALLVLIGSLGSIGVLIRALVRRSGGGKPPSRVSVTITDSAGKKIHIHAQGETAETAARLVQDALTDLDEEKTGHTPRASAA